DDVTDRGILPLRAAQHLDAHDTTRAGIIRDVEVCLHLNHDWPPSSLFWARLPPCPAVQMFLLGFRRQFLRLVLDHNPTLVFGDRSRLLDEDEVAHLAGVALVMRLVALALTDNLPHHRMGEAALDLDDDRLIILVADDSALHDALRHGPRP